MTAIDEDPGAESVDVHFIDVGQGDCTVFIDREQGVALVVDCPAQMAARVAELLKSLGVVEVAAILITHWDLDHYGGALELADTTECAALYYNRDTIMASPEDKTLRRAALLRLLEEPFRSMNHFAAHEGVTGTLGSMEWELLAPSQLHLTEAVARLDRNMASALVRATAHGSSVMVCGDADGRVWQRLIDARIDLNATVLRWPHHGSSLGERSVAPADVLGAVDPMYVVISVGSNNPYGHPKPEVVTTIASRSIMACTEVTRQCHASLQDGEIRSCGGTLSFSISEAKGLTPGNGWARHSAVVDGWMSPMCRSIG